MTNSDTLSYQQQLQQQIMMNARQQQMQMIAAQQQQQAMGSGNDHDNTPSQRQSQSMTIQPQSRAMGSAYDGLPIVDANDLGFIGQKPAFFEAFEAACRNGSLSNAQSIVSSETRTAAFLHRGLTIALSAGNVEIASYLLSTGAPIVRQTPNNILSAPSNQQIPLFELLTHHGWTPNTPGYYGAVLLPRVVNNLPLLGWFLAHGANPNLGPQRDNRDRTGGPSTDSCAALELTAGSGDVEAVRMLLDAGAKIQNGVPLHFAAGVSPPGMNPYAGCVTPSKEFDSSRIPVMVLLVGRGADVNQVEESRHVVARYAIVHPVMAGAVERVRWLLDRGADPEARGAWGSAVDYARTIGSEEMRRVVEEGVIARRWVNDMTPREVT